MNPNNLESDIKLKELLDSGTINNEEYNKLKNDISDSDTKPEIKSLKKRVFLNFTLLFVIFLLSIAIVFTLIRRNSNQTNNVFPQLSLLYKIDTSLNVELNGKKLILYILQDKYNPECEPIDSFENPAIKVMFINPESKKIVYFKKINAWQNHFANEFAIYYKNNGLQDELLINAIFSSGGSGWAGKLLLVEYSNEKLDLVDLTTTNRMTDILLSKTKKELLKLNYKWESGETHFDNHKIQIQKYSITDNQLQELGETQFKYDMDSNSVLDSIMHKEPDLLNRIGINPDLYQKN